ncbi:MAG: leucyl aminopeptidase [Candidatus Marinimicrobia bacterium]|jgi:leucyl aminopeptidase|nr:leucyl aminopeptidase [Candidatus Neomarinimicrobiota bacterium]
MELLIKTKIDDVMAAEILFVPVLEGDKAVQQVIGSLQYDDQAWVLEKISKEKFQGKQGQLLVIPDDEQTVVFIGTGQANKLSVEDWRQAAGQIVTYLRKFSAQSIAIATTHWLKGNADIKSLGQALAEGIVLASYDFDKYKKEDKNKIEINIAKVFILATAAQRVKFRQGWQSGLYLAEGTVKARDLVNEPASVMTPTYLAKQAEQIAKDNKNITVKILDKAQVKKLGMGAFLSIDQGSSQPLKFIHLIYKPIGRSKDKVAVVGKGLTFDSGGLNIKLGDNMEQMKIDMGGAATVIGLFAVIAQLKPKVEVHGIVAACENMPSGAAIKPGDIVKNMQGKTIEIGNTDAEGRVTMADSLAYAQKLGVSKVVDLATLTGAVMIALGTDYTGLFSNNEKLAKDLLKSSDVSGEKIWLMPMPLEYKKLNQSKIADIKNIPSTRYGGSITAAMFLQEFIEEGVAWAHLDIAGPAYAEKPLTTYIPAGGVGFGVRTLLEWLKNM